MSAAEGEGLGAPRGSRLLPPRRDGAALGFGIAFVAFGVLGVLRESGVPIAASWLYPVLLIGLGVAGLLAALLRERR